MYENDEKSSILQKHSNLQKELKSTNFAEQQEEIIQANLTDVISKIQAVLNELQPYISSHGGRVEFVEIKDFVVFIRFYGACLSCPLSFYTLTYGVERHIKGKIPSILRVEALE